MSDDNGSEALRERLEKLEKRLARRNIWMAVVLILTGFVLGAISSCTRATSDTIEARKIVLKDPSGHTLAVLGVDNKWDGVEGKTYYAGIEFRDEKGEKTLNLFGTGLFVRDGDDHASLQFTGLEIGNKESEILLNHHLFSFAGKGGSATLIPSPTGMDLTITSVSNNEVGMFADGESASLYAASPKWETDVSADKAGTRIVRGPKPRPD
jgi:hypothetical protein